MTSDTREKMVKAAALLFGERGYAAVSFQDVIARSGAPRGSIYHHFPGGKEQLAAEALRWYAERTRAKMAADREAGGPAVDAVSGYFTSIAYWLRKTDYRAGCPVGAVALDLGDDDALQQVVREAFDDWRRVLERAFLDEGCAPGQARAFAALVIAASEGGIMLARAERDVRPYEDATSEVLAHLRGVLQPA
ncbi:MAG: TetR/AcrR family transcriptional regulator [Hamadaea sp.]|nr:TetR/AcrR family transcriptional regulator [Hamadaea sp.]